MAYGAHMYGSLAEAGDSVECALLPVTTLAL